jgi:hypothetical protein
MLERVQLAHGKYLWHCTKCGWKSSKISEAEPSHEYKRMDSSQDALRIVREATEDK